eukprot:1009209-Amphidinium_carterae.2
MAHDVLLCSFNCDTLPCGLGRCAPRFPPSNVFLAHCKVIVERDDMLLGRSALVKIERTRVSLSSGRTPNLALKNGLPIGFYGEKLKVQCRDSLGAVRLRLQDIYSTTSDRGLARPCTNGTASSHAEQLGCHPGFACSGHSDEWQLYRLSHAKYASDSHMRFLFTL